MNGSLSFASISKDRAIEILRTHRPKVLFNILSSNYRGVLQVGSAVYTDYAIRKTAEQQRKAFEAFEKFMPKAMLELINLVQSKENRVPEGAFNSLPHFTTAF